MMFEIENYFAYDESLSVVSSLTFFIGFYVTDHISGWSYHNQTNINKEQT